MANWSLLSLLLVAGWTGSGTQACVVMHMGTECPQIAVQENFDIIRYVGRWFEYEYFPNYFEMGARCVIANYTLFPDNVVKFVNVAIQEVSFGLGICPWYRSTMTVANATVVDKEPAKFEVAFSVYEYAPNGPYWVLETDYDTYSIAYGCIKMPAVPVYMGCLLTRERSVAPANLDQIKERLTA